MATEQGCWEFNPGSTPAKDAGCTCAVLDNNHGQRPPWPPDGWWITEGCPLHDLQEAVAPPEVEQAPSRRARPHGGAAGLPRAGQGGGPGGNRMIAWYWIIPFTIIAAAIGWTLHGMVTERQQWRDEERREGYR